MLSLQSILFTILNPVCSGFVFRFIQTKHARCISLLFRKSFPSKLFFIQFPIKTSMAHEASIVTPVEVYHCTPQCSPQLQQIHQSLSLHSQVCVQTLFHSRTAEQENNYSDMESVCVQIYEYGLHQHQLWSVHVFGLNLIH